MPFRIRACRRSGELAEVCSAAHTTRHACAGNALTTSCRFHPYDREDYELGADVAATCLNIIARNVLAPLVPDEGAGHDNFGDHSLRAQRDVRYNVTVPRDSFTLVLHPRDPHSEKIHTIFVPEKIVNTLWGTGEYF